MNFRTNTWLGFDWTAVAILVIALGTWHGGETTLVEAAPPAQKTAAGQPDAPDSGKFAIFTGRTDAVETIEVRPGLSGRLIKTSFQDGQLVQKGELLFEFDPRPYQAELNRAMAETAKAKADLVVAKADYERLKRLVVTAAGSQADVEKAAAAAEVAVAAMQVAEAAVAADQLNLESTRITSPISGRIGRALVSVGNWVQPNTLLAHIVSQDPIYVYFDVDEKQYQQMVRERGREVGASGNASPMPVQVALSDELGFPRQGVLNYQDIRFDPQTGTTRLRAILSNPDRVMLPGLFVRVRMPRGQPAESSGGKEPPGRSQPPTPKK